MPNLTPEAREQLQAEYDASRAKLEADVATCRYCKAAKTRTGKPDAWCTTHKNRSRGLWACSPLSETYWAS